MSPVQIYDSPLLTEKNTPSKLGSPSHPYTANMQPIF